MRSSPTNCELAFIAAGFVGCESYVADAFRCQPDVAAAAVDTDHFRTNVDKVFACGDMRRGQSLWSGACARAATAPLR